MKLSTDRILTTHVGSLPRPQPLAELLVKKDQAQPTTTPNSTVTSGRRLAISLLIRSPSASMW